MGFFSKSRTLESTAEAQEEPKKKGGLMNGLLGGGRYAKTDERKDEIRLDKTLAVRLGDLKIKKYKDSRLPRYNDNHSKQRLEVGSDFDFRTLPNLIYSTAKRNGIFRSKVGGRFDTKDRDALKLVMRRNSYKVSKIKQQLNDRNEGRCKVSLSKLFE